MNRNSIEDNQVLEELLRCSSDSESDDLFQDDTDNDPDFTTDGLLGDATSDEDFDDVPGTSGLGLSDTPNRPSTIETSSHENILHHESSK
ncbi:hypothetical protein J6590_037885 [Homalodisca vitripennis]|nr:hypothetical protein J6590_063552 [Homalodisca vitripennis]KAG8272591.1 hypothetical protein J6590_037885 [Homalodisca vitripennis]